MSHSSFVICVANDGWDDLKRLRVYRRLPDELAESDGWIRVVDDSGEDYLYPVDAFLSLPSTLSEKLELIAPEPAPRP